MLGEQIKQRRQQEKLTQKELAKLLNISPSNISKWENNKAQPKKEILEQLNKLWNISFEVSKPESQNTTTESQNTVITHNEQEIETNASKQQEVIASNEEVQEEKKWLSSGTVDFKELIDKNLYYVDKTYFISELMRNHTKINLITRPRRFGKTLTMSMLKYFFDINGDKSIFKGLKIEKDVECCKKHMGQYPVISITLGKIVSSKETEEFIKENFEEARENFVTLVVKTARQFRFLLSSKKLNKDDKKDYKKLLLESMPDSTLTNSLATLTELLYKHYGKRVIILIDEYDVPLQKAYVKKYYKQMVDLIRNFFANTFKFYEKLELGVITGCLRVSKEEIFTGFNNLEVFSVLSEKFNTALGFTEEEVKEMMSYYHIEEYYNRLRDWYEGYKFYGKSIFCPWDTLLCCKQMNTGTDKRPKLYWTNTSHNQIVYDLLEIYADQAEEDVKKLLSGRTIEKNINEYLNYKDIDYAKNHPDNDLTSLWSMLLMTGYLTAISELEDNYYELKIPNYEIRKIYQLSLMKYLRRKNSNAYEIMQKINNSISKQNAEEAAQFIHEYLSMAYPIGAEKHQGEKEVDYQNILVSVFNIQSWILKRETETGIGRSDFIIRIPWSRLGIVMEFKHVLTGKEVAFNNACNEALAQIEEKNYADYFATEHSDYHVIYCGMAFYHQDCKVVFYDPKTGERKESGISGALVQKSTANHKVKARKTASTSAKSKSSPKLASSKETEEESKIETKSTRKAKKESKADKKSGSKAKKESFAIEVSEEKQKIIKNLAEIGMTAKKIAKIVELPEKIVKKYM